ncbi:MAG TPA: helix-turn-helix domain-containing protein [Alphaproteobacteria bacterium]
MPRPHDWFSARTGEEASGVLIVKGARYPRGLEFMTMFADGWRELAKLPLKGADWRVLAAVMARIDYGNTAEFTQGAIAIELGVAQPNVAVALRRLVAEGVLTREAHTEDRRRTLYRVNLRLGWKGKAKDWMREIQATPHQVQRTKTKTKAAGAPADDETFLAENGLALTVEGHITEPQAEPKPEAATPA